MVYQDIIYTKEKGIGTLTLNRPAKGNAYTRNMCDEIVAAIEEVKKDGEVRVLVIKGDGRHFCAGYDLDDFPPPPEERHPLLSVTEEREGFHKIVRSLRGLDKPAIASVDNCRFESMRRLRRLQHFLSLWDSGPWRWAGGRGNGTIGEL